MSLLSYVLVIHTQTDRARWASDTYLAVAILGGMTTLLGILLLYHQVGTLRFDALAAACAAAEQKGPLYAAGALIFVGFGAKAGLWPMHIWLPTAHPVAPAPASAVLSGVITKCGVFGVVMVTVTLFAGVLPWGLLCCGQLRVHGAGRSAGGVSTGPQAYLRLLLCDPRSALC